MSHKHKVKIEKLFEHPISGNIDEKKMISALEHYGMKTDHTKHGKVKVLFKEQEYVLSLTHNNTLSKDSIVSLRHFLEKVDLVPGKLD